MTVNGDLLAGYRRDQHRRGLSVRTINGRRRTLDQFARWLEPKALLDVTQNDLEEWLDTLKLGPRSLHTYVSTLRNFYDWLERSGVQEVNPARHLALPRLRRLVPRPITDDDLAVAMRGARPRMKAWLALAAFQGLRCQEIATLCREDLLLDRDPPVLIVSVPKGGQQAVLPLNPEVESALHAYGLPTRGPIFHLSDGRPMNPKTVSLYISRYLKRYGVNASAHQLRHWFGTTLYAKTRDIRLCQEMLRHSDVKTTSIYVAFSATDATVAVRSLGVSPPSPSP